MTPNSHQHASHQHAARQPADHQHATQGHAAHGPEDHDESDLAELLELDAEVFGSYLDEIIDLVEKNAPQHPRTVADLGAGTGAGSLALARRFSGAEVIAIDSSAFMLERLDEAATTQGFAGRVRTVQADLDVAWPSVGAVDIAWAAASMHHFADPERVFRDVHSALNPGGVLAVIEFESLPRFLPDDIGQGRVGLESRLHQLAANAGWNAHPDWAPHLERAGFELIEQRDCVSVVATPTSTTERHARSSLAKMRSALGERFDAEDAATLDRLLADQHPDALLSPSRLRPRSVRTVWVARRPDETSS